MKQYRTSKRWQLVLLAVFTAGWLGACATNATGNGRAGGPADSGPGQPAAAQVPDTLKPQGELLPPDPRLVRLQLDNGLVWQYQPLEGDTLYLTLQVATGSLMEADNEQGLAHFVEHMAFNGSRHFKAGELWDLQVRQNIYINAWTSYDATTFMVSLPSTDARLLEQALWFLQDVTAGLEFQPAEVDRERGVVLEELRRIKDPATETQTAGLLWGPAFAARKVIGTPDCLKAVTAGQLKDWWSRWYRPEHMNLAIVGNLPLEQLTGLVESHFGPAVLPRPQAVLPVAPSRFKPHQTGNLALVQAGTNLTVPTLNLFRTDAGLIDGSAEAVRTRVVALVLEQLYLNRWSRLIAQELVTVQSVSCELVLPSQTALTPLHSWTIRFTPAPAGQTTRIQDQVEVVAREHRRLASHGFAAAEWQAVQPGLKALVEQTWPESPPSGLALAFQLNRHARGATDAAVPLLKRNLALAVLEELDLASLNQACAGWLAAEDLRLTLELPVPATGPQPVAQAVLGQELVSLFEPGAQADPPALPEPAGNTEPAAPPATPGSLLARDIHQRSGVKEFRLSNGSRILWVKPANTSSDRFVFRAWAPGGLNNLSDTLVPAARLAADVAALSPTGGLDSWSLDNFMKGKEMRLSAYIGNVGHGLNGEGSVYELEAFLKLVHARVAASTFADSVTTRVLAEKQHTLKFRAGDARSAADDACLSLAGGADPRVRSLTSQDLEQVTGADAAQVWQTLFGDPAGCTWIFVGLLDEDELAGLAETWLASLPAPATRSQEPAWRVPEAGVPMRRLPAGTRLPPLKLDYAGAALVQFRADGLVGSGLPDQAPAGGQARTWNDFALAELASQILHDQMFQVLRQEQGGLYAPELDTWETWNPLPFWNLQARFPCDPRRAEALGRLFLGLVDRLGSSELPADSFREYLDRQANYRRHWQRSLTGQADLLNYAVQTGLALNAPYDAYQQLGALDPAGFRDWCRANLAASRWVQVVVQPGEGSF